jgi:hypothetical protein
MTTSAVPLTLEQKLLNAAIEADKIVATFNPAVAELISAGIAIEPIISGIAKMVAGIFQHHVNAPVAAA